MGVYGGAANINEVVTIAKAISCDIQDGEVDVYLTVLDPTGNPVKDVNGVLLNEVVLTDADIQIKLTSYGFYLVRYKAMDNADEVSETTYAIIVPDTKKPVITISGELVKEAKVGDLIDVPSATATDNYDAEVDVKIYIATPTTEMIELEGDKKGFKAMATGEYRVIYRARDAEGNSMTIVNVIVVKEA